MHSTGCHPSLAFLKHFVRLFFFFFDFVEKMIKRWIIFNWWFEFSIVDFVDIDKIAEFHQPCFSLLERPTLLPPLPSPFSPLSCQACGPKTLLRHLRLRSSSGQIWRLALAQVSVRHPHTPQPHFARFRCSAGRGEWISPLAPLSLLSTVGLSSLPSFRAHLRLSWDNRATITCTSFWIPCGAH